MFVSVKPSLGTEMPSRPMILVFVYIVVATVGSAWANLSLKSTMRSWKADAASMDRMLTASSAFDEARAARILQGFAADSRSLLARVTGTNAQARDVKARFEQFSADAQSASEAVASREKTRARYAQLRADCRSCHDVYAN
jgi:cytochrome c556